MTFREKLNRIRAEKGWSVKTLAEATGLSVGAVNGYCYGGKQARKPTYSSVLALSLALGVDVGYWADCDDLQPKSGNSEESD